MLHPDLRGRIVLIRPSELRGTLGIVGKNTTTYKSAWTGVASLGSGCKGGGGRVLRSARSLLHHVVYKHVCGGGVAKLKQTSH